MKPLRLFLGLAAAALAAGCATVPKMPLEVFPGADKRVVVKSIVKVLCRRNLAVYEVNMEKGYVMATNILWFSPIHDRLMYTVEDTSAGPTVSDYDATFLAELKKQVELEKSRGQGKAEEETGGGIKETVPTKAAEPAKAAPPADSGKGMRKK